MIKDKGYVLVKYYDQWADEFDIHGFFVTTEKEWNKILDDLDKKTSYPQERYFGTNEFVEFASFEDFYNRLTVKSISEDEFITLGRLFAIGQTTKEGGFTYGTFITPNIDDEDLDTSEISD